MIALCALLIGIVLLICFIRRQSALSEPLIDLRPLTIRSFAIGVIVNMLSLLTIFAMNIIVPTFMQSALGTSPLVASLTLFPAILCSCVVSPLAGCIYDRQGPGILLPCGFACIAVFSVLTSLFIATASPLVLVLLYIPVICGSALIIGPVQSFALSKLTFEMNPHGVTVMSTGFQIAGCIGSSMFTGVYTAIGISAAAGGVNALIAATEGMIASGALVGIVALIGLGLLLWIRVQVRGEQASKEEEVVTGQADERLAGVEAWEEAAVVAEAACSGVATGPSLASVMKTDVYAISQGAKVADAMRLFAEKGISGAPIVDENGCLVGFVSDGDVMRVLADQVPAFKSAWSFVVELGNADFEQTIDEAFKAPVSSIATHDVIVVDRDDEMGHVARVLADNHLKKVPVVSNGKMVGIVNRSNITRYAVNHYLRSTE